MLGHGNNSIIKICNFFYDYIMNFFLVFEKCFWQLEILWKGCKAYEIDFYTTSFHKRACEKCISFLFLKSFHLYFAIKQDYLNNNKKSVKSRYVGGG